MPLVMLVSGFALALMGCQGPPQKFQQAYAQLQREKIEIEDQYYLLESDYIAVKSELEKCRGGSINPGDDGLNQPGDLQNKIPEIQEPDLGIGNGFGAVGSGMNPNTGKESRIEEVNPRELGLDGRIERDSGVTRASNWVPANHNQPEIENARIVAVEIDPDSLSGYDTNGQFGDDGFEILIQPLDDEGGVLPEPGDITIMAVDPSQNRTEQQIGQWLFAKASLKNNISDQQGKIPGIRLAVPFDQLQPQSERLLIYVTYKNAEGQTLQTSSELQLTLPGKRETDRWTENRYRGDDASTSNVQKNQPPGWSPDR